MSFRLVYTKQAHRDAKKLARSGLKESALRLPRILETDPFRTPPKDEKLCALPDWSSSEIDE